MVLFFCFFFQKKKKKNLFFLYCFPRFLGFLTPQNCAPTPGLWRFGPATVSAGVLVRLEAYLDIKGIPIEPGTYRCLMASPLNCLCAFNSRLRSLFTLYFRHFHHRPRLFRRLVGLADAVFRTDGYRCGVRLHPAWRNLADL
jgi:hypothetical protein